MSNSQEVLAQCNLTSEAWDAVNRLRVALDNQYSGSLDAAVRNAMVSLGMVQKQLEKHLGEAVRIEGQSSQLLEALDASNAKMDAMRDAIIDADKVLQEGLCGVPVTGEDIRSAIRVARGVLAQWAGPDVHDF
jgi:hypothetical protein